MQQRNISTGIYFFDESVSRSFRLNLQQQTQQNPHLPLCWRPFSMLNFDLNGIEVGKIARSGHNNFRLSKMWVLTSTCDGTRLLYGRPCRSAQRRSSKNAKAIKIHMQRQAINNSSIGNTLYTHPSLIQNWYAQCWLNSIYNGIFNVWIRHLN